jgi:hypothetical protein
LTCSFSYSAPLPSAVREAIKTHAPGATVEDHTG